MKVIFYFFTFLLFIISREREKFYNFQKTPVLFKTTHESFYFNKIVHINYLIIFAGYF